MSPEVIRNTIPEKYEPTLNHALDVLAEASPDNGKGRPEWRKEKAYHLVKKAKDICSKVIKHPVTWLGLTTFAFNPIFQHELISGKGILLESIVKLNQVIASLPGGNEVLKSIQSFAMGPFPFNTISLIRPENPPLVNLTLAIGSAIQVSFVIAVPASIGIEKWRSSVRKERKIKGIEPIKKDEIPRSVMIGPSEFLSAIAIKSCPKNKKRKNPGVLIHADVVRPKSYDLGKTDYHFDIHDNPTKITDCRFMKESGIDRTENLILAAFDPDHALFYGRQASSKITLSALSTLVALLSRKPREELKNKNILVIAPKDTTFLTHTTAQHELFPVFRRKGIKIETLTPEDIILEHIKGDFDQIKNTKGVDEKVHVCLVGGADIQMIKKFKFALESLDNRLTVDVICDKVLGELEENSLNGMGDDERKRRVEELLKCSDINYVYGDTDQQTTDLANLIIERRGAERNQTVCLLEREEAIADAQAWRLFNICIYKEIATAISEKIIPTCK